MDVFDNARWFKSSRSGQAGHCVEVAFLDQHGVGVRDSKDPTGGRLLVDAPAWSEFVAGVRAGEFGGA